MYHEPRDLLIECGGCGIENQFGEYTPGSFAVCNQCREKLIVEATQDSHTEYVCEDCGFTMLMLNDTPVVVGETACRCGGTNIIKMETSSLVEDALNVEAEDAEDDALEDDDWLRPGGPSIESDYNDLFDDDPGQN